MELFRRFPLLPPSRKKDEIVPPDKRSQYPAFQKDFEILEEKLMPTFWELDNKAVMKQYKYRRLYVGLILGGTAVSIVGIVQLAISNVPWIGFIGTSAAVVLLAANAALHRSKDHEGYLNARLAAEELRREYFLFLGRRKPYEN